MAERKAPEYDTARETPQSKQTIAVRTGKSDPPAPPGVPAIRPAAGSPPPQGPAAFPRTSTTLPRAIKPPKPPAPSSSALWVAAAALLLLSVILMLAMRHTGP